MFQVQEKTEEEDWKWDIRYGNSTIEIISTYRRARDSLDKLLENSSAESFLLKIFPGFDLLLLSIINALGNEKSKT